MLQSFLGEMNDTLSIPEELHQCLQVCNMANHALLSQFRLL